MKATALSLFVVWHLGAMLVAPMPDCYFKRLVYPTYEPYLALFHLESGWGFFAPDPGRGLDVRFLVTDATGTEHRFDFTRGLDRSSGTYLRFTSLQDNLLLQQEPYLAGAASHVCRRPLQVTPIRVRFEFALGRIVHPDHYLAGARSMDEAALQITRSRSFPCPAS